MNMSRARAGNGVHRQFWIDALCPHCEQVCRARRTLPGKPLYVRTHVDKDGNLCPPAVFGETRVVYRQRPADPNQLELFA